MAAESEEFFRAGFAKFRVALRNLLCRYGVVTNSGSNDDEIVSAFDTLLARRQTELDEDQIIFLAELVVLSHLKMFMRTPSLAMTLACTNKMNEMMKETLRSLLRISLQDPRFREKFNEYFSTHPVEEVKTDGMEWLSEVLSWEK